MRRREVITLICCAFAQLPLSARAQQLRNPLIGILHNTSRNASAEILAAYRRGLNEAGYVEEHNVAIEYCFADGQIDRLPALAADLVTRRADVLFAGGNAAALAAKAATMTIPIVFVIGGDPVKLGLIGSLNRPGGNLTGITFFATQLESKRLGLLHELVPRATLIAVLVNPRSPASSEQVNDVTEAARALGLQVRILQASSELDLNGVFEACAELRAGALLVAADPLFYTHHEQLTALAERHAIPAIYESRNYVVSGGLASYGANIAEGYRIAGLFTGKILRGAKAADLPTMQTTKFEFIINLRTAKALGVDVAPTLSARADEIIE